VRLLEDAHTSNQGKTIVTGGAMENPPDSCQIVLVISVWTEMLPGNQLAWRGSIRSVDGRRRNFNTLTGLNQLLQELSGWQDSPNGSMENPT
jgi:hypothetical protein